MGVSPLAILLIVMAMVAAACSTIGGDDPSTSGEEGPSTTEADPTTTTAETTTTAANTTTTLDPGEVAVLFENLGSGMELNAELACFFSGFYLFARDGDAADEAVAALAGLGILSVPGYIADPIEDAALAGEVTDPGLVGPAVVTFDGSQNAFLVSEFLRSEGIAVAPVHMVGMAGHWQAKPGNDPVPVDARLLDVPVVQPDDSKLVGVVDTGLVSVEGFEWVLEGVIHDGLGDDHDLPASHGTFIASLIRQADPTVTISFAKMEPKNKDDYFQSWPEGQLGTIQPEKVASEIEAYAGIATLIERHSNDKTRMKALSLSWGTYPCESVEDFGVDDVDALAATLDVWWERFEDAPVFAAAGNEPPVHGPFYPAAFDDVQGVAADSGVDGARALVWDGGVADVANLPWASLFGPGCDLVGVGGPVEEGPVVAWGGSSFATPMMALSWMEQGLSFDDADQTVSSVSVPQANLNRC